MTAESALDSSLPPRVTGNVDIARFPSREDAIERWRVSIGGRVHFLSDADTARRIFALSQNGTYAQVYACYAELAGTSACTLEIFMVWSNKHRAKLEQLAETPDGHPLRYRRQLLSESTCMRFAHGLTWLFHRLPAVLLLIVSASVVGRHLAISPTHWHGTFWLAVPLALVGIFVHELGHITACVRYGARQGGIGVGLYWIWPAFYADVRGSWSLPSRQRLQVSAGGLYFQTLYAALLAGLAFATGEPTFGMALQVTLVLMATTCNPVFKYDGYWILADLFNITNVHTRIARHLTHLVHGRGKMGRDLLASRWTWLSVIFVACATGYIAFIGLELFRSASGGIEQLSTYMRALAAPVPTEGDLHLWLVSCGLVAQLALVGLAILVLGMRSLRATASVFQGRGDNHHARSKQESGTARPAVG